MNLVTITRIQGRYLLSLPLRECNSECILLTLILIIIANKLYSHSNPTSYRNGLMKKKKQEAEKNIREYENMLDYGHHGPANRHNNPRRGRGRKGSQKHIKTKHRGWKPVKI